MTDSNSTMLDEGLLKQFVLQLQTGDKPAAMAVLEYYLREHPKKASSALLFVASLLSQNSQYLDAIPLYLESIRLNPGESICFYQLGLAYQGLGKNKECHRTWDELAKRFPRHPATIFSMALRLIESNQLPEATALLDQIIPTLDECSPLRADVISARRVIADKSG